ncbi:transporter [Pigmentibacter ruber]|uniref:transporter n=1 Tax=Pigmentibacter ruber TaxID=2683196 RepID=UPI00131DBBB6|nr:transporter [Pigmentibacter ruber]BFD33184.1 hypothetical protein GTC16762_28020 [Pigmentibacter ruber]
MFKLYITVIISFLMLSLNASAEESEKNESKKINLDIYGYFGYTSMSLQDKDINGESPNLTGSNLTVGGLYTIQTNTKIKPVVGLALQGTYVTGDYKNDVGDKWKVRYNYSAILANAGIKYNINEKFNFIGLGSLGTTTRDEYEYERPIGYPGNLFTTTDISNHYIYSVNLMGLYKFGDLFSMGANATLGMHTMEQKFRKESKDLTYFEKSINLLFMWSI